MPYSKASETYYSGEGSYKEHIDDGDRSKGETLSDSK